MARTPPTATPEQLALAFRQVRRPGWPSTLEAALQRPHYALAIRGIAHCLGRAQPTAGAKPPGIRTAPVPATPRPDAPPQRTARSAPRQAVPAFDGKRAAANDRDD